MINFPDSWTPTKYTDSPGGKIEVKPHRSYHWYVPVIMIYAKDDDHLFFWTPHKAIQLYSLYYINKERSKIQLLLYTKPTIALVFD